jgi:dTDP-4-amino-4,6-dideoxygalactose transaminase
MRVPFVDLRRQFGPLRPEIEAAFADVIGRCAFIGGAEVKGFEEEMARWLGSGRVCAVSNGTHALTLTLKALGVGPGDEVITAPNTAYPTAEAIHLCGAEPVFADIGPGTFSLDPKAAEEAITERTRAVIPVHLYGIPADMDAFLALAAKHELAVIEDVAQAQGALYRGRKAGTIGEAGCFSFFPSKNLGAFGDGGAVASADPELLKTVRMMANHGREEKYTHVLVGTNSRLDTLKAAQLKICLNHLDRWNGERRQAAARYHALLAPVEEIRLPEVPADCEAVWHVYAIRHGRRDALAAFLKERGIRTGLHYPVPLHLQPVCRSLGLKPGALPQAEAACREVLSLPMFPKITRKEIEAVAQAVIDFMVASKAKG